MLALLAAIGSDLLVVGSGHSLTQLPIARPDVTNVKVQILKPPPWARRRCSASG